MIAYIVYEYMQISARICKDRLNIRLVRFFFVHLKVLRKYSGSYHFRLFWSTGDEMISRARFVTRPEVGGDMRFPSKGSLSGFFGCL